MSDYEDRPHNEQPAEPVTASRGTDIPWGLAITLLIAIGVVVFAVQNTQTVEIRFLGWERNFPLAVVLLAVVIVSVVLDEVFGALLRRRRRRRRQEREELRRLRRGQGEGEREPR
jgi:uncharacterized integral membrane protein